MGCFIHHQPKEHQGTIRRFEGRCLAAFGRIARPRVPRVANRRRFLAEPAFAVGQIPRRPATPLPPRNTAPLPSGTQLVLHGASHGIGSPPLVAARTHFVRPRGLIPLHQDSIPNAAFERRPGQRPLGAKISGDLAPADRVRSPQPATRALSCSPRRAAAQVRPLTSFSLSRPGGKDTSFLLRVLVPGW